MMNVKTTEKHSATKEGRVMKRLAKLSVAVRRGLAISSFFVATSALAGPELADGGIVEGATVGAGGLINGFDTTIVVQSSQVSYIDWATFNLAAGEAIDYQQPDSSAISVNRISAAGGESLILGNITANGHVFLINPAGVIFGGGSQVSVGGLVVSTLALESFDENSLTSTFVDGSNAAGIVNQGDITSTNGVTLIGNYIQNEGSITATGAAANLNLIAAERATLTFDNDGLIQFQVDEESGLTNQFNEDIQTAIDNTGSLEGGNVFVTVDALNDVYASAVNHEGLLSATRVDINASGNVVLRTPTGSDRTSFNVSESISIKGANLDFDRLVTDEGDSSSINIESSTGDIVLSSLVARDVTVRTNGTISQLPVVGVRAENALFESSGDITLTNVRSVTSSFEARSGGALVIASTIGEREAVESIVLQGNSIEIERLNAGYGEGESSSIFINSIGAGNGLVLENLIADSAVLSVNGDIVQAENADTTVGALIIQGNSVSLNNLNNLRDSLEINATGDLSLNTDVSVAENITLTGQTISVQGLEVQREQGGESRINLQVMDVNSELTIGNLTADSVLIDGGVISQQESAQINSNALTLMNVGDVRMDNLDGLTDSLDITSRGNVVLNGDVEVLSSINISAAGLDFTSIKTTSDVSDIRLNITGVEVVNLADIATANLTVESAGAVAQTSESVIQANELNISASEVTLSSMQGFSSEEAMANAIITATSGDLLLEESLTVSGDITLRGNSVVTSDLRTISDTQTNTISITSTSADDFDFATNLGTIETDRFVLTTQGNIVQNGAGLSLAEVEITAQGSVTLDAGNAITDSIVVTGTSATINNTVETNLGNVNLSDGRLTVISNNGIRQIADSVIQAGELNMTATGGDIVLQNSGNEYSSFAGQAVNIRLANTDALSFGELVASGDLQVAVDGAIDQVSNTTVDVAGETNLSNNQQDVTLTNEGNNFGSVTLNNVQTARLADVDSIVLNSSSLSGALDIVAQNNIVQNGTVSATNLTFTSNSGSVTFNNAVISEQVNISAESNITQLGSLTAGSATLTSTNGNITLNDIEVTGDTVVSALNDIEQSGSFSSGNAEFISSAGNVSLGTLTVAQDVVVRAQNDVTQTGTLTAANVEINATQGAITLDTVDASGGEVEISAGESITQAGGVTADSVNLRANGNVAFSSAQNSFASIAIDASSATVRNSRSTQLADVAIGGNFTLNSGGAISQLAGTSVVANSLSMNSNGAIDLQNNGNQFSAFTGESDTISLATNSALSLGDITAQSLTLNVGGDIMQSELSSINVSGVSQLQANGQNITLANAGNDFATVSVSNTQNLILVDNGTIALDGIDVSGDVNINAQNDISQTSIVAQGNVNLTSNTGSIALQQISAGGSVNATASGDINHTGSITSANTTLLSTAGGVTVNNLNVTEFSDIRGLDNVTVSDSLTSGSAVLLSQNGNVNIADATVANEINVNAQGDINLTGTVNTGNATFVSESGSININNLNSTVTADLQAQNSVTVAGTLAAVDATLRASELALNNVNVSQSLNIVTPGDLTHTGNIEAGDATLEVGGRAQLGNLNADSNLQVQADSLVGGQLSAGNSMLLLSNGTIVLDSVSANEVTLASNAANATENDVDDSGAGVQVINVGETSQTTNIVNVVVQDGVTVNLSSSPQVATSRQVDNGFLLSPQSTLQLATFDIDSLATVAPETLTVSGLTTFGAIRAQTNTDANIQSGDNLGASQDIFLIPEQSLQLPEDQKQQELFDDFSFRFVPKNENADSGGFTIMPVSR